ncbi:hypothetical protein BASA81_008560 [Batrachochytrium salamandrivorans]|nr:hypothetical protein BASA81_008560 [Batrachochytrium salamandrivorans]
MDASETTTPAASAMGTSDQTKVLVSSLVANLRAGAFNPLPNIHSGKQFLLQLRKEVPKLIDVRAYSRPATGEEAMKRIRANYKFFRAVYTLLFTAVCLSFVLTNPTVFVASVLLAAMWSLFFTQPPEAVLRIGQAIELKRNEQLVGLVSLTGIVVFFSGLISSVLYVAFTYVLVVGMHGSMREEIVLDALERLEQEGEQIRGEDVV